MPNGQSWTASRINWYLFHQTPACWNINGRSHVSSSNYSNSSSTYSQQVTTSGTGLLEIMDKIIMMTRKSICFSHGLCWIAMIQYRHEFVLSSIQTQPNNYTRLLGRSTPFRTERLGWWNATSCLCGGISQKQSKVSKCRRWSGPKQQHWRSTLWRESVGCFCWSYTRVYDTFGNLHWILFGELDPVPGSSIVFGSRIEGSKDSRQAALFQRNLDVV